MPDCILIEALELTSRLGVPDEERANPQRLTVTLTLEPLCDFRALDDSLENTVDYSAVCEFIKTLAHARPRHLLETLAEEIATALLAHYPLRAVKLDLRKYILPDTQYVAVKIRRSRRLTPEER